jgi:putative ABC transport system permease protein
MTAGPPPSGSPSAGSPSAGSPPGGPPPGAAPAVRLRALPRQAATTTCGTAAAASLGLSLLVFAAVLVSMAIPRASLGQRTQALQRSLATLPATSTAVIGNLPYPTFGNYFPGRPATAGQLAGTQAELAAGLARQGLPVATASAWVGLASGLAPVTGFGPRAMSSFPPKMEILYRDRLDRFSRLVTGHLPRQGQVSHGQVILQIAVTGPTAARFGLRPGSRLGFPPDIILQVTGIVTPDDRGSAFWGVDPIAPAPALNPVPPPALLATYWVGACFIGPAEVPLLQSSVPIEPMQVWWAVPLSMRGLTAGQVTAVAARLNGALNAGGMVQTNGQPTQVTLSSGLTAALGAFSAQDQAIGAVLGLLFVSLAVIGIVAVLLGAGLVATRRSAEFTVMRTRGASLRQVAGRALAASAALALPAAAAAAALAIAVTPGSGTAVAWWLAAGALAAALAGLPLFAVGQQRGAGRGREGRTRSRGSQQASSRRTAAARRLVAEAALAAAAVGGIIVLRRQGLSPGSVDVYPSAAPVLVAILAAIVVVHGYPVVLRLLLRLARSRPGVSAFVGLAQATRTSRSAIVPAFALVLALAVVAFGSMIDGAVYRADSSESWHEVGADALVDAATSSRPLSPAAQREIAAVPGAARTATMLVTSGMLLSGTKVTVTVLDPSRYAALVARTPGPAFPAAALARRPARAGTSAAALAPALASASAAGVLSRSGTSLTVAGRTLRLRSAGRSPGIPGVGTGAFLVLPAWALSGPQPPPSVMLIVGPQLDVGALAATVRRDLPGAHVTFRGAVLAVLGSAPLPAAAHAAIAQGAVAAAAFSALILLIWLLMGAHSRDMTLARLATMGLGRGQARWLVVLETLPLVLAAVAGGVASAYALAPLIAPSITLSAFAGAGASGAGAEIITEPLTLAACAAGLILLSALALAVQFMIARGRGVTGPLRVTE